MDSVKSAPTTDYFADRGLGVNEKAAKCGPTTDY